MNQVPFQESSFPAYTASRISSFYIAELTLCTSLVHVLGSCRPLSFNPHTYLWMAVPSLDVLTVPSLVSFGNFMNKHSITSPMSLIKMLNGTGPRKVPTFWCSICHMQPGSVWPIKPLMQIIYIFTLWCYGLLSQAIASQLEHENIGEDNIESLADVKVNCSLPIHQVILS